MVINTRMHRVIATGKSESHETVFELPGGEKCFYSIHQPLFDQNKKVQFVQIVSQDLTKSKKAEADRIKLMQHLQQHQKLESLGVLAGGIAHDFNNLMGGFLDIST